MTSYTDPSPLTLLPPLFALPRLCQPQDPLLTSQMSCCMSSLLQTGPPWPARQPQSPPHLHALGFESLTSLSAKEPSRIPGEYIKPLSTTSPGQRQQAPPEEWVRLAPPLSPGLSKIQTKSLTHLSLKSPGGIKLNGPGVPRCAVCMALHPAGPLCPQSVPLPPCLCESLSPPKAGVTHLLWGASPHPASTSHPMATQGSIYVSICRKWITHQTHESIVEALVHGPMT